MEKEILEILEGVIVDDNGIKRLICTREQLAVQLSNLHERVVIPKIAEEIKPQFNYDKEADVMYIIIGNTPRECNTFEAEDLAIRRTLDGKLKGITIVDYSKKVSRFSA